ncbi:hypothetical protein [Actinacidiphila glaucinigra]|uniref:hypothetical protein n=1 Tax=Actinacidiphila glaucinigra TaxID=235986 RepID=UPI003D924C0E
MLIVFRCRQCDAPLSNPLTQADWKPLPMVKGREHYTYGPSTVAVGFFSPDPDPYAPAGSVATWVINPLDGVLLRPHTDPARLYGCCRPDGLDGPNLLCARCGSEVGIERADCWTEYDIRLLRSTVVEGAVGGRALTTPQSGGPAQDVERRPDPVRPAPLLAVGRD